MKELDQDQCKILRFIERYQNEFGRVPSYEEIRTATGMRSKDHVYRDVKALEKLKYLRCQRGISRGITLLRTVEGYPMTASAYSLPVLGSISAGNPIPLPEVGANQPLDWVEVTRAMIPDAEGVFAIRVHGNSMIDALVNDGDTVVLKQQDTARDGELVAVRLKNDPTNVGTTLKRLYSSKDRVRLQPENPTLEPIDVLADEVEVQGIVLCVIRQMPESRITQKERALAVSPRAVHAH